MMINAKLVSFKHSVKDVNIKTTLKFTIQESTGLPVKGQVLNLLIVDERAN